MSVRSGALVAALALVGAGACGGGHGGGLSGGDAGLDAGVERSLPAGVSISVTSVSMSETPDSSMSPVHLEIAIANGSAVAIQNAGVVNAQIARGDLGHPVSLGRVPTGPLTPIAPGETRALVFEGTLGTLLVCTADVRAQPNPHRGLVTLTVTVLTEVAGMAFSGVPIDVTCPPSEPDAGKDEVLSCTGSAAVACMSPGMPGGFNIHCSPTWDDVLGDTSLCDTGVTDLVYSCEGYLRRSTSPGNGPAAFFYDYYYDRGSGALVAVIARAQRAMVVCQGGPAAGFVLPICSDPPQTKPGCPPSEPPDGGSAEARSHPGDGP